MIKDIIHTMLFSILTFAIIYVYTSIPTAYYKNGECQYWRDVEGTHDCSTLPNFYEEK